MGVQNIAGDERRCWMHALDLKIPGMHEQAQDIPVTEEEVEEIWNRVYQKAQKLVDVIMMAKKEFEEGMDKV